MVGGRWWLEGIDAVIGNILWNSCKLPVSDIYELIQPQQNRNWFQTVQFWDPDGQYASWTTSWRLVNTTS